MKTTRLIFIGVLVGGVVGSALAVTRRVAFGETRVELKACRYEPYCEPHADIHAGQNHVGVSFDLGDKGPSWVEARPLHIAGGPSTLVALVAIAVGGSDQHLETAIIDADPVGIREVLSPHIASTSQDAVCLGYFGKSATPGLLVATFQWGDEAHYDAHRFSVARYDWNGRSFDLQNTRATARKHKNWKSALNELGYRCDHDLVSDALGGDREGALESKDDG